MRMHSTSVYGFGVNIYAKTEQMIKKIKEMSIDMTMIKETNCKRNKRTIDDLRKKLGRVNKDNNMSMSDSK